MPVYRTLFVFLTCTSFALGADLRTLPGTTISGDLVGISNKEITIKTSTDEVTTPVDQVLELKLAEVPGLPKETRYTDIELTDDTLLHCTQFVIKGNMVEVTTGDRQLKIPLKAIVRIQRDANDEKLRREWKDRLASKKTSRDLVLFKVKREGAGEEVLDLMEGTLGDGDEAGESIEFSTLDGVKRKFALARIHGLVFQRSPDPQAASVLCKLYDTQANLVMASALTRTDKGITITTPAGATIDYPLASVARLDFSKGKLTYLSDDTFWLMGNVKLEQFSTEDRIEKPGRDKNLDGRPIRLGGTPYPRGLSVHSQTTIEFNLAGEYREFKAVIGVDDLVGGRDGPTVVVIEGDGKELLKLAVSRKDKPRPVTLNIKDVQRLRLMVSSGDLLDLGKHVDFADAKVSK